ncbi:MAG: hypothetical protein QOH79_3099 [Acidimicrobiaceae bacterium]
MLARHAENLFWAGRYIERAEDTARILDVTYHGLLEASPTEAARAWADVLVVLRLSSDFGALSSGIDAVSVSQFLVSDRDNPGSIVSAVARCRENLRSVRELVSTELWESVNRFHLDMRARNLWADIEAEPYQLYAFVKERCQMVAGAAAETMPRDDGWRFLQIGWMLERAEMTCRLLHVRYSGEDPVGFHHWLGTLKSASASEAYRRSYRGSMDPANVLEFLLLSPQFPRSVLFCLRRAEHDLASLGRNPSAHLSRPERLLGRIRADLEYRDVTEVVADGVPVFLDELQRRVRQVAEAVALEYFRNSQELDLHALESIPAG